MRSELSLILCESFPNLYKYRFDKKQSFYFGCGDGWFNLLYELSAKLEAIIVKIPIESRSSFYATTVKEKYGTLRIYLHSETDEMGVLIDRAETISETTCEVCGEPGKISGSGWLSVRCNKHLEKKGEE